MILGPDFRRGKMWPAALLALLALPLALPGKLNPDRPFTLEELEAAPTLTPKQFAGLFEYFDFQGCAFVQPPDQFLHDRCGDCDDYAILADFVLSRKGYHTRLIQVLFAGDNIGHAVCYVTENKAYLDYNNRKYFINLERSGRTLRQIADKIAGSFELDWTTAAEFTFSYDTFRKKLLIVVVKTDAPDKDPDRGRYDVRP